MYVKKCSKNPNDRTKLGGCNYTIKRENINNPYDEKDNNKPPTPQPPKPEPPTPKPAPTPPTQAPTKERRHRPPAP